MLVVKLLKPFDPPPHPLQKKERTSTSFEYDFMYWYAINDLITCGKMGASPANG